MYGDPKRKISRNFKTWESAVWKCNANTRFIARIKNVIFTRVTNDKKWNVTLNNKSWHMKNLLVLCPQHHTCWVYEELISPVSLGQPPELMHNYDDLNHVAQRLWKFSNASWTCSFWLLGVFLFFLQSLRKELLSLIFSYSYGRIVMFLFRTQELDLCISSENVMTCSYARWYRSMVRSKHRPKMGHGRPLWLTTARYIFTCARNYKQSTNVYPEQRASGTCKHEAQPYCITSQLQLAPDLVCSSSREWTCREEIPYNPGIHSCNIKKLIPR